MGGITIAGRVGFDTIDQLEERFDGIVFPIELALPWRYGKLWVPFKEHLFVALKFFQDRGLQVGSIHATQGRISDDAFLEWGRETLKFADALGIKHVTIHPNQAKSRRKELQEQAHCHLTDLHRSSNARFCMETFDGERRIFHPTEIMECGLPMTLDVAHIHDDSRILEIVDRYWHSIPILHLSARGEREHHLPVDDFCVQLVRRLKDMGWTGQVVLEYLPWHHYRVRGDIRALSDHILGGRKLQLLPLSDKYRNDPQRWGYNEESQ